MVDFSCYQLFLVSGYKPLLKLFLIGDSISIRYSPFLEKYVDGFVLFDRKRDDGQVKKDFDVPTGANGGDSQMVPAYLRTKVKDTSTNPDYLLLTCGLHNIRRNSSTNKIQVEEQQYGENLEAIIEMLRGKSIQLIWIRTTPVVDSIHNVRQYPFCRYSADLLLYNKIAYEVCQKNGIPKIDFFYFTRKLGIDQFADHVYYKKPALDLQAAFIAGCISFQYRQQEKNKYLSNRICIQCPWNIELISLLYSNITKKKMI